jgi:hypothetical protein
MNTCGTYQLSLEASAARPGVERGPRLLLDDLGRGSEPGLGFDALFAASPISSIRSAVNQPWMQVEKWDEKPAFTVATTDHHIPRPLERSP